MHGLAVTHSPYVAPLDADDLAEPGMLSMMADRLDDDPEAVACVGDILEFGDVRELVRAVPQTLDPFRVAYTNEYPVTALFRRTALDAVGGWYRAWTSRQGYEDWNLWMDFAQRGWRIVHLGAGRHRLPPAAPRQPPQRRGEAPPRRDLRRHAQRPRSAVRLARGASSPLDALADPAAAVPDRLRRARRGPVRANAQTMARPVRDLDADAPAQPHLGRTPNRPARARACRRGLPSRRDVPRRSPPGRSPAIAAGKRPSAGVRGAARAGAQRRRGARAGRGGSVTVALGGRGRRSPRDRRAGHLALRRRGCRGVPAAGDRALRAGARRWRDGGRDRGRAGHRPLRPPQRTAVGDRARERVPPAQPAVLHRGGEGRPGGVVHEHHDLCLPAGSVDVGLRPDRWARPHGLRDLARRRARLRGGRDARAVRQLSRLRPAHQQLRRPRPGALQGPQRLRPLPRAGGRPRAARAARAAPAADRPDPQAGGAGHPRARRHRLLLPRRVAESRRGGRRDARRHATAPGRDAARGRAPAHARWSSSARRRSP